MEFYVELEKDRTRFVKVQRHTVIDDEIFMIVIYNDMMAVEFFIDNVFQWSPLPEFEQWQETTAASFAAAKKTAIEIFKKL